MAGRPISAKYKRRINAVRGVTIWLREEARKDLEQGLKDATEEQLYKRTPLKVTRKLFRSIGSKVKGQMVEVGYNLSNDEKAKYASSRINMMGRSKLGGHIMDMSPRTFINKHVDPKLRRRNAQAQKKILGD